MEDKNIELVNVVQVILVRRILPCQHRTCNLWEFDPAKNQTLRELFGSSHEGVWKVLLKPDKSWPDSAEDRGYQLSRPASLFSYFTFYPHNPREMLSVFSSTPLGLDEEGGADPLSGPAARKTGRPTFDEDAGLDAVQGAEEEGREGGQKDPGWPSSLRHFRHNIRRFQRPFCLRRG